MLLSKKNKLVITLSEAYIIIKNDEIENDLKETINLKYLYFE
jgi:hypothetical protein